MRTQYWAVYPRNFANEFTIYRVSTEEHLKKMEAYRDKAASDPNASVERITLEDAKKMLAAERDRRKYDKSSAYNAPAHMKDIEEFS